MYFKKCACMTMSLCMGLSSMNLQNIQIHAEEVSNAKEVLYLDFDEGNVIDKSGVNNHGTIVGNVTYEEGAKGKSAHIKNATGSSSKPGENYIDLGSSDQLLFGKEDFSISIWYKTNAGDENGGTILGSKNYNSGRNVGFALGSFTNEIRANMADGKTRKDIKFTPVDNTWHHSALICDRNGMMSVYTDGDKVSDADISGFKDIMMQDGHLMIGADGFGNNSLIDSYIDEVHIYKGLLNDTEIKALYTEVKDVMDPPTDPEPAQGEIVLQAAFDGNVTDDSKYKNHGEVVGDLSYVEGIKGKALHIYNENGSTSEKAKQYVNFGKDSSLQFGKDNLSLTYWYRSDNGVSDGGALISNKDFGSGSNKGFNIGNFNNGFRFNFTAASSSRRDLYDIAPIDGEWHKVGINVDRDGNMSSYFDGKLRKSMNISGDKGNSIDAYDFVVGADGLGKNGLNDAYIDELIVVKDIVSEKEIEEQFLSDKLAYEIRIKSAYASEAKKNSKYDKGKIQALESSISHAESIGNRNDYDIVMAAINDMNEKLGALNEGIEGIVSGQMLYVSFDKRDASDETGRDNHGMTKGNVTYEDGVLGKAAHIVNENGSKAGKADSYINFGKKDDLRFGSDNFAIAFWYKSEKGGASEGALFSNKDWASGNNPGLTIGNFTSGLRMNFTANGASRKDIYNIGANDDDWHYIVVNVDRDSKMKAYVDNEIVNETSIVDAKGKSIDVGDFVIGADGIKNYGVDDVYLDEVRVFNRLMSDEEKANFYYSIKLNMELKEMDKVIVNAKEDASVSKEKLAQLVQVVEDIQSKIDSADYDEIQSMIRRLAMAYDRFTTEDVKHDLTFNVLSDVHIEGTDPKAETNALLIDALEDIAVISPESSAIMIPGDITNGGSAEQYKGFFDIIDKYASAEPVVALGNHDVRSLCSSEDRNEPSLRNPTCKVGTNPFADRYLSRNEKYMGDTPKGQLYFDKWVDGYHFITLNTEADLKDQAYLSQEQLTWLDKKLAENADPKKPIILQIHQTFEGTADHEELDVVGGEEEAQLKAILSKYPQAVIFTGHVHNGVDLISVYQGTWGHLIDVPCLWYSSYGSPQAQVGFQVNVDGSNVEVKFRDFKNDKWLSDYDMKFDITDPIPADPSDDSRDLAVDGMQTSAGNEQSQSGSEGPSMNVLDNNEETLWHTAWGGTESNLHYIDIDLGESTKVDGLRYLPRQTGSNGIIKKYEIYTSNDNGKTYTLVTSGKWKANTTWKTASFDAIFATNIKLIGIENVGEVYASAAEIRITAPNEELSELDKFKEILKSTIDDVQTAIDDGKLTTLAPAVSANIRSELKKAQKVYNAKDATLEECVNAWLNLAKTLHYLDFVADKADLKVLIDLSRNIKLEDYVYGISAFTKALNEAQTVYDNANVLQESIDKAYTDLLEAKLNLKKQDDTFDNFKALIDRIIAAVKDGSDYKKDKNWTIYETALKNAFEVYANKDASKDEIKSATKVLTSAYESLRLLPSEEKLKALEDFLHKVEQLDEKLYSKKDYAFIKSIAVKALEILNDFDELAYADFQENLKIANELIDNGKLENPENPSVDESDKGSSKDDNKDTNKNLNTSDSTNSIMMFILSLISMGAIVCVQKKRKNR